MNKIFLIILFSLQFGVLKAQTWSVVGNSVCTSYIGCMSTNGVFKVLAQLEQTQEPVLIKRIDLSERTVLDHLAYPVGEPVSEQLLLVNEPWGVYILKIEGGGTICTQLFFI